MRIAIVHWSRRNVGGAETYISLTAAALAEAGHQVALWHEIDKPTNREPMPMPYGAPSWCVAELGVKEALERLRSWRPDLIYSHGLEDPRLEAKTIRIAPSVFSAHAYFGTCISGLKTFRNPTLTPCNRRFGWQCLVNYYPRRCGGLSPITMLKLYDQQSRRLKLLRDYNAILTFSRHMTQEYIKHDFPPERVHGLSYHTPSAEGTTAFPITSSPSRPNGNDDVDRPGPEPPLRPSSFRLLFAGRMDRLKGGRTFIEALPMAQARLGLPLHVTFVGDGPDRVAWEKAARRAQKRNTYSRINFTGWATRVQLETQLAASDLLVFPSQWPEPFGLLGPEAGLYNVPVAAFAVGGVPDWLIDGVNGHLAPGDPPTAAGLADAIVKCLAGPTARANLSRGAGEMAQRFSLRNHLPVLLEIFESVVKEGRLDTEH